MAGRCSLCQHRGLSGGGDRWRADAFCDSGKHRHVLELASPLPPRCTNHVGWPLSTGLSASPGRKPRPSSQVYKACLLPGWGRGTGRRWGDHSCGLCPNLTPRSREHPRSLCTLQPGPRSGRGSSCAAGGAGGELCVLPRLARPPLRTQPRLTGLVCCRPGPGPSHPPWRHLLEIVPITLAPRTYLGADHWW